MGPIAYSTMFSIAPLLIITTAIAGFFFGAEAAQGQTYAQARSLLGKRALRRSRAWLLGASGVFAELQGAMDRIWQSPVSENNRSLVSPPAADIHV
jgi:membrane protein